MISKNLSAYMFFAKDACPNIINNYPSGGNLVKRQFIIKWRQMIKLDMINVVVKSLVIGKQVDWHK